MSEHQPAWLTAAIDQRVAKLKHKVPVESLADIDVVQTTLTDPKDDSKAAFVRWDNSCDNCGAYNPKGLKTSVIETTVRGIPAVIIVGACKHCWRLS